MTPHVAKKQGLSTFLGGQTNEGASMPRTALAATRDYCYRFTNRYNNRAVVFWI